MIYFILGIIVGLLVNPSKEKVVNYIKVKKSSEKGTTQFIDPISIEEKFKKSKNIDEFIK